MGCATLVLSAEVSFIFWIPSYFLHVFWLNPNRDNFDILYYLKIEIVFPLFIVSDLFPVNGGNGGGGRYLDWDGVSSVRLKGIKYVRY